MADRPSDALKHFATELSALLFAKSTDLARKEHLFRLLRQETSGQFKKTEQPQEVTRTKEVVGIWKKTRKNERIAYMRDITRRQEWMLWADIREIPPVTGRKRIVLLGESVARGSFYDPSYTVAEELEAVLSRMEGMEDAEVIDLAKTGIFFKELQELVTSCSSLNPDAVVIFGGNNLSFSINQGLGNFYKLFSIYEKDFFPGVISYFEEKFKTRVMEFLQEVERALTATGIPVVYVIPEFNLKDWKSTRNEQMVASFKDNRLSRWLKAKEQATQALSANDMPEFERAATLMVSLDPSNPLGYEWLAQYYISLHRWDKARECLESARDTAFMNRGVISKPRCYKIIQQTVLTHASDYGVRIVHLPSVFEHEYGGLPDREFFLDYCHLSLKGIKTAMRHTARLLAEILTGRALAAEAIPDSGIWPSEEVQSIAHFCAAIHNAHYGQPAGIVQYHCNQAVSLFPKVGEYMARFADFSTRYASNSFCRSFAELTVEGETQQIRGVFSLIPPRGRKLMDIELVDRITSALQNANADMRTDIQELRIREHGVTGFKKDLLESYYSTTFYDVPEDNNAPIFLQAHTAETVFHFIATPGQLEFEMVYRTPGRDLPGEVVEIYLNDSLEMMAQAPARSKWSGYHFTVREGHIKEGANKLVIRWPYTSLPAPPLNINSPRSAFNTVFPVLGEVSSFTVNEPALSAGNSRTSHLINIQR